MKTIKLIPEIEDWPEDVEEQGDNLSHLESIDVPYGEVVEARAEELD